MLEAKSLLDLLNRRFSGSAFIDVHYSTVLSRLVLEGVAAGGGIQQRTAATGSLRGP